MVSVFSVRAHAPRHCDDPGDDAAEDERVLLPVGGLRVPASGWRPDICPMTQSEMR